MPEQKINMFDTTLGAYREMPKSAIIRTIREAKKLEKDLVAKGVITAKEVSID